MSFTRVMQTILSVAWLAATSSVTAAEVTAPPPTYIDVKTTGLIAHLYLPAGPGPFTTIIAVSGSEGGISTGDAFGKLLVREGFAVLGVAYFGMPGLPEKLDRIALENFSRAIDYLQAQSFVDPQRIGIVGGSRGAELALVLAALEPRIRRTCAFVPTSVVWQSARAADMPTSSWTLHGQQLPFVPYKGPLTPASGRYADLFELSLTQHRAVAAATIAVEKINGPILLISADRDEIWPSRRMSEALMQRLDARGFAFAHEHVRFDTPHFFTPETAPQVERRIIEFFR